MKKKINYYYLPNFFFITKSNGLPAPLHFNSCVTVDRMTADVIMEEIIYRGVLLHE